MSIAVDSWFRFINEVEKLLERDPIDLRVYEVILGVLVDLRISGLDNQIENSIRGIREVTTVKHIANRQRRKGEDLVYREYAIKFELTGRQSRDTYRDYILVPAVNKDVKGVKVVDRGPVKAVEAALLEWGGLGYAAPPVDPYLPTMQTPRGSLNAVVADWVEGGVQLYDFPTNTNEMQYHVMMPVEELWDFCSREYRGTATDFDGRYKNFIKNGAQMPVYVAIGKNGRVKITGNEDLIWFAKKSGLKELPVFFSYQLQV